MGHAFRVNTDASYNRRGGKFEHRTLNAHVEYSAEGIRIFDLGKVDNIPTLDSEGNVIPETANKPFAEYIDASSLTVAQRILSYAKKKGYTDVSITLAEVGQNGVNVERVKPMVIARYVH
jgi:hypothetical protein